MTNWEGVRCALRHEEPDRVPYNLGFTQKASAFVEKLFDLICDYNVAPVEQAVRFDIEAIHFGDDWGSQRGLLIGRKLWERFLMPRLARQYAVGKRAGKMADLPR
jgi:hypothetical protein